MLLCTKESNNTLIAVFKRLQMDKLHSVDLPQQKSISKPLDNNFFNQFKRTSMLMYSYPIRVKLFDLKLSKKAFIKILAKKGLIYDYYLMCAVLEGRASSSFSINYFTHLYKALNITLTIDLLTHSFKRWEEIKAFKLDRRNANRIKKGLQPVNSISTRVK